MTFLEALEKVKADAEQCNRRLRAVTGVGQKPNYGAGQGRTKPVIQRRLAVRQMMHSMTIADMAEHLGVSVSTIKGDIITNRTEDENASLS